MASLVNHPRPSGASFSKPEKRRRTTVAEEDKNPSLDPEPAYYFDVDGADNTVSLMRLPNELLDLIVNHLRTPLDDIAPLWLNTSSDETPLKALSQVNRRLWDVCIAQRLCHVRLWELDHVLATTLREMYYGQANLKFLQSVGESNSLNILYALFNRQTVLTGSDMVFRSLTIRTINGSVSSFPLAHTRPWKLDYEDPDLQEILPCMMVDMHNLTEFYFATDNGMGMEQAFRNHSTPGAGTA
ncbi:hypothetical protein B0H66DRAFT_533518 [Apodospora peruviana]|uniref:Uncharacterized protein n=1 Tax=Apodospora peruviana TaxID=516989 RepID=A0AAE0I5V2_9PEZI|nr:hypothetical protein B0H66DRAFT_533518 [Apodospora peruviana]